MNWWSAHIDIRLISIIGLVCIFVVSLYAMGLLVRTTARIAILENIATHSSAQINSSVNRHKELCDRLDRIEGLLMQRASPEKNAIPKG